MSFCRKSKFIISISLQPDGANLWYFKLRLFDLAEFIVWKIKGLQRYRNWKIRICGKTHFLLANSSSFSEAESANNFAEKQNWKYGFIMHFWSGKSFWGTVVNRTLIAVSYFKNKIEGLSPIFSLEIRFFLVTGMLSLPGIGGRREKKGLATLRPAATLGSEKYWVWSEIEVWRKNQFWESAR